MEWYAGALEMQSEDEVGEFDPLVDTPPHAILATMAQLYSSGDSDLPVNPSYAGGCLIGGFYDVVMRMVLVVLVRIPKPQLYQYGYTY